MTTSRGGSGRDRAPGHYLVVRNGTSYLARRAEGLDYLGDANYLWTREAIEQQIVLGADITFEFIPPGVKVSGLPTWAGVLLGALGIGATAGLAYAVSRR